MLLNLKWRWLRRYGYPPENKRGAAAGLGANICFCSYQIRANGNDKAKPGPDMGAQMELELWLELGIMEFGDSGAAGGTDFRK